MTPAERWIAVTAPALAVLAVIVGLRIGAPETTEAAIVLASPGAAAATGMALQLRAFADDAAGDSALAGAPIRLRATALGKDLLWAGATNADGVAEAWLPLPSLQAADLELTTRERLLAYGPAQASGDLVRADSPPVWMPFARREGRLRIDVAVLGQRVVPGVAAMLCVRVEDEQTRRPVAGAIVEMVDDTSWMQSATAAATGASGWAVLMATPVGLATALELRARAGVGAVGTWSGGVFVSPGAPRLETRARWAPDEAPELGLSPATRPATEYVEVDDAVGRAWATTLHFEADGPTVGAVIVGVPRLAPGLYWAIASDEPEGAPRWSPGTADRPFFVAVDDDSALAYATDPEACAAARDPREGAAALWPCLAVAAARPAPRWIALDGRPAQRARLERDRRRGLVAAVGAVVVAALLELIILLRAATVWRRGLGEGAMAGMRVPSLARASAVAVALLVGLLGFALLSAFLLRAG